MSNLDVTKAIQAKSNQLNADDLIGGPLTIKITGVDVQDRPEQPITIYYEGDNGKPFKPCKTVSRCFAKVWGTNAAQWVGLQCTLYNDPTVKWSGVEVGGIRVSHMSAIDKPTVVVTTKSRGKKHPITIQPLKVDNAPQNVDNTAIHDEAREVAKKGRDAFEAWWRANKEKQSAAMIIMDELRGLFAEATAQVDDDDDMPPV